MSISEKAIEAVARQMFDDAVGLKRWDDEFYSEERAGCLDSARKIVALPDLAAVLPLHDDRGRDELLAALKALAASHLATIEGEGFDPDHSICSVLDDANAAIAKAEEHQLAAAPPAPVQEDSSQVALNEIEEIADDRADVDDGVPNAWMRVLVIAREALGKAR